MALLQWLLRTLFDYENGKKNTQSFATFFPLMYMNFFFCSSLNVFLSLIRINILQRKKMPDSLKKINCYQIILK